MAKPYPREFRDDVVAVARKGQAPLSQIAKDFGISEGSLANWMKQADIEDGKRSGLTDDERKQLRRHPSANSGSSFLEFGKDPGEPVTGIEPACPAWEAGALPLSYTGVRPRTSSAARRGRHRNPPDSARPRRTGQPCSLA